MYQKAHKIIISLLILAQAIVLWQGAFAAGLNPDTKETEKINCHQTTVVEHTLLTTTQDKMQNGHENNCCGDDCQCGHCICAGFGLIPSYVSMSFSIGILNHISIPIFLDWQPVLLLKPPRLFRR